MSMISICFTDPKIRYNQKLSMSSSWGQRCFIWKIALKFYSENRQYRNLWAVFVTEGANNRKVFLSKGGFFCFHLDNRNFSGREFQGQKSQTAANGSYATFGPDSSFLYNWIYVSCSILLIKPLAWLESRPWGWISKNWLNALIALPGIPSIL